MAFTRTARHVVAISPDGTKIAFIAKEQIYLRQIDELEARPTRGTDVDPIDFAFSPDGESIAFFVMGMVGGPSAKGATLKRIGVVGGKAVTVCPAGLLFGIRWQGSTIVFSLGDSIQRVDDRGGTPETLVSVKPDSGESFAQPQLLNEGRAIDYCGIWTLDSLSVIFSSRPKAGRRVDLFRRAVDGTGTLEQLTNTPEIEVAQQRCCRSLPGRPSRMARRRRSPSTRRSTSPARWAVCTMCRATASSSCWSSLSTRTRRGANRSPSSRTGLTCSGRR